MRITIFNITMTNLETALSDGEDKYLERFLELDESLDSTTKTALFTALDLAAFASGHYSKEENFTEEITYFGGYAVLAQLVSVKGEEIIDFWRGSEEENRRRESQPADAKDS